jgi:hypothetical protein
LKNADVSDEQVDNILLENLKDFDKKKDVFNEHRQSPNLNLSSMEAKDKFKFLVVLPKTQKKDKKKKVMLKTEHKEKKLSFEFRNTMPGFMKKTVHMDDILKNELCMPVNNPWDFIPVENISTPYKTRNSINKYNTLSSFKTT